MQEYKIRRQQRLT